LDCENYDHAVRPYLAGLKWQPTLSTADNDGPCDAALMPANRQSHIYCTRTTCSDRDMVQQASLTTSAAAAAVATAATRDNGHWLGDSFDRSLRIWRGEMACHRSPPLSLTRRHSPPPARHLLRLLFRHRRISSSDISPTR